MTSPEFLEARQVNRSAYVVRTALPTSVYLGVCTEHDRPVRGELTGESLPRTHPIECPVTGHLITGERLVAVTTKLECDGACMSAYRNFCGCGCGGANHGKSWGTLLGQSEQLDSALDKWRAKQRKVEAKREQRKQAAERKVQATFGEWSEDHADLIAALAEHGQREDPSGFLMDLATQVTHGRNGNGPKSLSPGQADAAIRVLADIERRDQELAARKAAAKPCPTGKVEISGQIVKVKVQEGYAYNTDDHKAVVQCDGYAVWVTLPRALMSYVMYKQLFWKLRDSGEFTEGSGRHGTDYYAASENCTRVFRGFKISFTAQVDRSEKDESFGFAKRPTRVTFAPPEIADMEAGA